MCGAWRTKYGVDNLVRVLQCGREIRHEGDPQGLELHREALVQLVLRSLRVEYRRLVIVVEEVPCSDEAIPSVVSTCAARILV